MSTLGGSGTARWSRVPAPHPTPPPARQPATIHTTRVSGSRPHSSTSDTRRLILGTPGPAPGTPHEGTQATRPTRRDNVTLKHQALVCPTAQLWHELRMDDSDVDVDHHVIDVDRRGRD